MKGRVLASKVVRAPGRGHSRSAGPNKFPRYVSIGNAKKVAVTTCVFDDGQHVVNVDMNEHGELIGVEIL